LVGAVGGFLLFRVFRRALFGECRRWFGQLAGLAPSRLVVGMAGLLGFTDVVSAAPQSHKTQRRTVYKLMVDLRISPTSTRPKRRRRHSPTQRSPEQQPHTKPTNITQPKKNVHRTNVKPEPQTHTNNSPTSPKPTPTFTEQRSPEHTKQQKPPNSTHQRRHSPTQYSPVHQPHTKLANSTPAPPTFTDSTP
jgi:hypothetical protein